MKSISHKGWLMLFLVLLSILACQGFARFSFGAIFPFMREGLNLTYQQAGFLTSSIFIGYLVGVINVSSIVKRFNAKKTIIIFLSLIIVSIMIIGSSNHFWVVFTACFFMGYASGGTFIPSLELVRRWFHQSKRGMAVGIAMAGGGAGMVFSGISVPFLVRAYGDTGWRLSWFIIAAFIFIIILFIGLMLKNSPDDINEKPLGDNDPKSIEESSRNGYEKSNIVYGNKLVWAIGSVYFIFGFSYLIYSTFLVDYFINDLSFSNEIAGFLFSVGGVASIISGFIWGTVSDRFGRMIALSFVFFIQTIVLLGLIYVTSYGVVFILVVLYGLTLWGVPTILTASMGDLIVPEKNPAAMGFITVFFGIGQLISPMITGYLVELDGNYMLALFLSIAACMVGGIGSVFIHIHLKNKVVKLKEAEQFEIS
ncbi:MFS transporter [Alkalihalobacterium alkalinitrilicum]|uniref:MFS transporter n=1 Tax=Alkalihalobacterium alkalinitrilicum TaxID=427920 RepID=UPI0009957D90|nr:MFS transporter [Alkalihalobacterium alkalinitrilicum]